MCLLLLSITACKKDLDDQALPSTQSPNDRFGGGLWGRSNTVFYALANGIQLDKFNSNHCYNNSPSPSNSATITGLPSGTTILAIDFRPATGQLYGCLLYTSYAGFSLNPDTIPHTYIAVNYSSGTPPLTYLWSWGDGSFSTGASPSHTYSAAGNYNICLNITDNTGCMDSFCYSSYLSRLDMNATIVTVNVINSITGLNHENINNDNITLCPNPVSNQLIVEINSLEPAEIIIHDMTSRKHFQKSFISSISINTELFSKGIYLYEVRNKTGVIKKGKVVKD